MDTNHGWPGATAWPLFRQSATAPWSFFWDPAMSRDFLGLQWSTCGTFKLIREFAERQNLCCSYGQKMA